MFHDGGSPGWKATQAVHLSHLGGDVGSSPAPSTPAENRSDTNGSPHHATVGYRGDSKAVNAPGEITVSLVRIQLSPHVVWQVTKPVRVREQTYRCQAITVFVF
jgi:hypothetical protein